MDDKTDAEVVQPWQRVSQSRVTKAACGKVNPQSSSCILFSAMAMSCNEHIHGGGWPLKEWVYRVIG